MKYENIKPGLIGEYRVTVIEEMTARHLGSGNVDVFATPELVRIMERAAVAAVDALLPEGYRTVGAHLDVQHLAPTPLGMTVTAQAELVEVEGRKLRFRVAAHDDAEQVGAGWHTRYIIDVSKFRERVAQKRL